MKVLIQRVAEASVEIDGQCAASIGRGLLLLAGFHRDDSDAESKRLAQKACNLRIFPDASGRLQYSVADESADVLAVPQFTLCGDTSRGRRPDFTKAMMPDEAAGMFDRFVSQLSDELQRPVQTGKFGANMLVKLVNDGPFTIMLPQS